MSDIVDAVREHYDEAGDASGLAAKVALLLDTLPPGPVTVTQLSGLDQFHVRGLAATVELANLARVAPGMHVLDAGCGLGGPSRYLADTFGCRVTGVDLTPSFVAIAHLLATRSNLADRVTYVAGDLLSLPFADASFDMVWTQHVVMNVRDRTRLYGELRRVLKPNGTFAFYDVVATARGVEPYFPVPWSETSATSALLTQPETIAELERAGLTSLVWNDMTAQTLAWADQQQQQAPVQQPLSLGTIMGPRFAQMTANLGRSLRDGRVAVAMGLCEATAAPG